MHKVTDELAYADSIPGIFEKNSGQNFVSNAYWMHDSVTKMLDLSSHIVPYCNEMHAEANKAQHIEACFTAAEPVMPAPPASQAAAKLPVCGSQTSFSGWHPLALRLSVHYEPQHHETREVNPINMTASVNSDGDFICAAMLTP